MYLRFIAVVLIAGACWWLSFDLGLHWWWPIWLAPVPVLWYSPRLSAFGAFSLGFFAFLLGRLAWLGFLLSVLPPVPAVIFTTMPALLFALAVLPARTCLRRGQPVLAALSFAASWTAIEFLFALLGRDGTIVSMAYTQASFLPVIQLAALTGVAGITFVLCLVPALMVGVLRSRRGWMGPVVVVVAVMGFGLVRLRTGDYGAPVKVGMVTVEEGVYRNGIYPKSDSDESGILFRYIRQIEKLGEQGARLIVLPEKALPVTEFTADGMRISMTEAADRFGMRIVAGYTNITPPMANLAAVFDPAKGLVHSYEKVHLFEGEAIEGFAHGMKPGILGQSGVAICKDLDFEGYMRNYGRAGIGVLYAPAWDFVRDGWWHSRVAIVGAVANGYSLVRNAREGRMTISDDRGRVAFEMSSESRGLTTMTGMVRPSAGTTLYSRWGDWFGWLMLATALAVIVYLAARRSFTRV
ncbi:nitrilase-related carbon-nitrogen hydrolase [Puia sp.]|uniref:nitrilase-related carbon-nitrogen hydrolase n=1 Tax=Puia sp. TaxID=2045100 RepID=UPI002F3F15DD